MRCVKGSGQRFEGLKVEDLCQLCFVGLLCECQHACRTSTESASSRLISMVHVKHYFGVIRSLRDVVFRWFRHVCSKEMVSLFVRSAKEFGSYFRFEVLFGNQTIGLSSFSVT